MKFRDGEIVEEFTTLVNPGRPIPPEITMITRITDRDVLGAPPFERIEAPLCASSARPRWSATT